MEVFLYLLDMYIDFQFILSSCDCIGNKFMVGVGLPLPRRTKSFVPVLYINGPVYSIGIRANKVRLDAGIDVLLQELGVPVAAETELAAKKRMFRCYIGAP